METVVEVNPKFEESSAMIINGDNLMEDQQQGEVKEEIHDDDTISADPEVTRDKQRMPIFYLLSNYLFSSNTDHGTKIVYKY